MNLIWLTLATGLTMSSTAQATLFDRGGGLIYDDVLNVTWLQDAGYARTSGYDTDGRMTWDEANAWAAGLVYHDNVRGVNFSDWRMPTLRPVNGSHFDYAFSTAGNTDYAYNISAPGTSYANTTASELSYMFYVNLGNKGYYDTAGTPQAGYGLVDDPLAGNDESLFINLVNDVYWTDSVYTPLGHWSWYFYTGEGVQNAYYHGHYNLAWAVRDGDVYPVSASVPEPVSLALLLVGLLVLRATLQHQ